MALSDPAGVELKVASDVLQVQQGVEALQRNMLEQWERDFANASDFVNRKYSSDREEVQKTLNEAKKALSDLDDRKDELEKEITEFVEKAANVKIPNPPCPPYDKVCEKARDEVQNAARKLKSELSKHANDARVELDKIKGGGRAAAQQVIEQKTEELVELDRRVQTIQGQLAAGTLRAAVDGARAALTLSQKLTTESMQKVAEWKRADARVQGMLAVWRHNEKAEDIPAEPAK